MVDDKIKRDITGIKRIGFVQYFILFFLIFFSHDTMMFGQNSDTLFVSIGKIVPLFLSLLLLIINRKKVITLRNLAIFSLLILFQMLSCLIHNESINNYVFVASVVTVAFLYVSFYSFEIFKKCFIKVLFFFSIYSFIVWVFSFLFPSFIQLFPKSVNSNGLVFYNLLFCLVDFNSKSNLIRNTSIFREPGVYVIYLLIGLIFSIHEKKVKKIYLIVFLISILTTFSTAGYIVLSFLFLYYWAFKANAKFKIPLFLVALAAVIIIYFSTDLLLSTGPIFSKFDIRNNQYGSYFARLQSIRFNLQVFFSNPLFGVGRYGLYGFDVLGTEGVNNRFIAVDNTNTVLIGFASYGLMYGIMITLGLLFFSANISNNWFSAVLLFVIILLFLSNEDVTQNPLFYILVFDGLFNHKKAIVRGQVAHFGKSVYAR